jgi:hypothetical protein
MTAESARFIKQLCAMMAAPNFKGVPETMFCPLSVVKDFAQASILQFLVMKDCDGGWEVQDGAFPPPASTVSSDLFSYPDETKMTIVLVHSGVSWDLIVPLPGQVDAFW